MPGRHADRTTDATYGVCVFGAAPDTGNLGVCALGTSLVAGLRRRDPALPITLFDHGSGIRKGMTAGGDAVDRIGAVHTRRPGRANAWRRLARAVDHGSSGHAGASRVREAAAILDISAGDSFTDLYGPRRFEAITAPKQLALSAGRPLVLLPQTYGPFRDPQYRSIAAELVRGAAMAWARDTDSHTVLADLAGAEFDPARHRLGVDLAFALPTIPPERPLPLALVRWLESGPDRLAVNISGLLHNAGAPVLYQPAFRADPTRTLRIALRQILEQTNAHVLLVPHVHRDALTPTSDARAAARFHAVLRDDFPGRVACLGPGYDECQSKWIIAQADWFVGGRMHATIAALSSGVPAAVLAYSPKPHGVFKACGQLDGVIDLRTATADDAAAALVTAWTDRDHHRHTLSRHLPAMLALAEGQLDAVAAFLDAPVRSRAA